MDISRTTGVYEYLSHMDAHGKTDTFKALEVLFGLKANAEPGNRAKKLHRHFKKTGLPVDEYCVKFYDRRINDDVIEEGMEPSDERSFEYTENSIYFKGTTEKVITNLAELIEFSKVDINIWSCPKHQIKTYDVTMKLKKIGADGKTTYHVPVKRTNYAVSATFVLRPMSMDDQNNLIQSIIKHIPTKESLTVRFPASKVGVVNLADFHFGAEVLDLIRTKDFTLETLQDYLHNIVEIVNKQNYSKVYIIMVGDYFESLTGLNHSNTFKSLASNGYGDSIMTIAAEMISKMIAGINNVEEVLMVAGNHDRITPDKKHDERGYGAGILAQCLRWILPKITITYHPHMITREIDGIHYVIMHGHNPAINKDPAKVLFEYGNNKVYNLLISGHLHTRRSERAYSAKAFSYEGVKVISMDDLMYRKIILPSLFTGNWFSESLGLSSLGGFIITQNNGRGVPIVIDFPL